MSRLDDVRRTIEAAVGNMTPEKAQKLAKSFEPNAAKEQVAKTAADILDWSQRNRERMTKFIRGEIQRQMEQTGVASRSDVDALKKRVRELERAAGMTASGRKKASAQKTTAQRTPAKKTTTKKTTAKRSSTRETTTGRASGTAAEGPSSAENTPPSSSGA